MAKFELPIEKFLITKIQEHFPTFDLRQGTAFRDMVIKPTSIFVQPYRDQANVIKRNMSLENHELMIDEEMDSLVANIFVSRRGGGKSTGTVRMYLTEAVSITVTTDTEFQTSDGKSFNPIETKTFLAEEIALNADGIYFYADITVESTEEGEDNNIDANSIVFMSGGPDNIFKVDNPASFASGVDVEDNAQLKQRAEYSITVRDLVIKKSIQAVLLENFEALREVVPIGYGDPEMQRDVIPVILDLLTLVNEETTGEIAGGNSFSDPNVTNWHDLGVKPGHELVIIDSPDTGKHSIDAVTSSNLILDSVLTNRTGITYGIDGLVRDDAYHIGGKVDIYIDSTGITSGTVVLAPAQEINEVSEEALPYYEGGIAFNLPMVGIEKLIEIDPATREQVGDALEEGVDYQINVLDSLYRYSTKEEVQIQLLQTDPGQPKYYIGSTLQVNYYGDPLVKGVQEYCDNLLNRVITADLLVRRAVPCFVDLEMEYRGDIDESDLIGILTEYIDGIFIVKPQQASDMISVVYFFNVEFVALAFEMLGETHHVDGTITTDISNAELLIDRTVKFIPRNITVTKVV